MDCVSNSLIIDREYPYRECGGIVYEKGQLPSKPG